MNSRQKAQEIVRLASIFVMGCGNTAICDPPLPATECDECSRDFLARINKVLEGEAPIDGKLLVTGWREHAS